MAEQIKVQLTDSKLEFEGVQVTMIVYIGDWRKTVSISPVDYKVFKKWHKIYAPRVIESIVKDIEYNLSPSERTN